MAEPITLKYRAFLSYAHADTAWAKRLHRRLENFHIDKDLVERATAQGTVPATLRPIFRDRDDFTAGHTLTDQTIAALDASAALIVLCSPASAKSHYLNEEVRLFKSRHPERPVIPVIIDGTPGDATAECFPPALRHEVAADGTVSDTPTTVLAADIRENGDGFDLAAAKVIARLLDLSTDDVFRRAERVRRHGARVRNAIIAALALLAVAATGSAAYALQQLKTNEAFLEATLKTATEIVDTAVAQAEKYNVPRTATIELLTRAERLFDDMARLGRPTPALQRQKAGMLIQFARNYAILGDTTKQRERAEEAHRIMTALADGGDELAMRGLFVTEGRLGDALVAQGNLSEALKAYRTALAIMDRLAKADPANTRRQGFLSRSYQNVGRVLFSQGELDDALAAYRDSYAIRDRLAEADPANVGLQQDLAASYAGIGDVLHAKGEFDDAMSAFRGSLEITERLAQADPTSSKSQFNLAIIYQRIGDVFKAQRDPAGALESYRAAQEILIRLTKADPTNALWRRDLLVSYDKIGDVLVIQSRFDDALTVFRDSVALFDRLAKADSANAGWQLDLAISHSKLASVYLKLGQPDHAQDAFRDGRAIMLRLIALDSTNALWNRTLAWFDDQFAALEAPAASPAQDRAKAPSP